MIDSLTSKPPVLDPNDPLAQYWDKRVSELIALPDTPISPEDQERHRLYCLLLMALVANFWNGNKRGQDGDYPWRESQQRADKAIYEGGRYLGHNIACLAVDGNGEVIDFDFNHNDLFSSSVEHAESRLVRRIFSLAQIYDDWHTRKPSDPPRSADYLSVLSDVTIYTSLESCAQCSGIMALGKVKAIVYLQQDPGQFSIGNILRNLTTDALRAPLPISADKLGLKYYQELNDGYRDFYQAVSKTKPFWSNKASENPKLDAGRSITSFLCTDQALNIYKNGAADFKALSIFKEGVTAAQAQSICKDGVSDLNNPKLQYSSYKPKKDNGDKVLSNAQVQVHTESFYLYATQVGQRGTPHKL